MGLDEAVKYLYDLQKFGTKLGLENTFALLELLGRPQDRLKFLHVTGTNGKGSVSALSASVLREAGYRTGLYTSPHLVSFTERMKLDGVEVGSDEVAAMTERLKRHVAEMAPDMRPTFFEFTTAMALDWFARSGAEVVVLEVGMGGRLDSTNAVSPECTVITNVDVEHTEYLGTTLGEIAFEKAGIIKPGVPLVTAEGKPAALEVIFGTCAEKGAPCYLFSRDFSYNFRRASVERGRVVQVADFETPWGRLDEVEVPLAGAHQLKNAACAITALHAMRARGFDIPDAAIREGIRKTRWEGRLEAVSESPLVLLDGAHNTASYRALADSIKRFYAGHYRRLTLVVGILSDKDASEMLGMLAPLADNIIFTSAEYERALPPETLMAAASGYGKPCTVKATVAEALDYATAGAGPEDMVLVTGSLYVIGEAKAHIAGRNLFLRA